MSQSYLKGLAELFYRTKGGELCKYRFFFQNKRAGTFFNHYLLQEAKGKDKLPLLLPETTTLYSYLRRYSNLPEEDINNNLLVIFHLFQIFKKHYPKESEDKGVYRFEQFYDLGKQLLADFNDIDLHLAPTDQIFKNMDELGDLTVNPTQYLSEDQIEALSHFVKIIKEGEKKKPFDKEYSGFWSKVGLVYSELKHRLKQERLSYTGMLMREIAEGENVLGDDKTNVFVGLNGLPMSEQKILKLFPKGSLFYWDYDSDLLQKSFTEKSREMQIKFPEPSDQLRYERVLDSEDTDFRFISIPSRVGQSIYIDQEIIRNIDWKSGENRAKLEDPQIAIILPDEGQLIPLLSNLSLHPEQLNITMGFPIKELPLSNKILRLLSLQKRAYNRNNRWQRDELKEMMSLGLSPDEVDVNQLFDKSQGYKLYFDGEEIVSMLGADNTSIKLLLMLEGGTLLENTLRLFDQIPTLGDIEKDVLELLKETLSQQIKSLDKFVQGDKERNEIYEFPTQYDLIVTTIKRARLPFEGEPLRGIQIMGMLEARSIDFETVIVMDAGEGFLPSQSRRLGLLPQSLRAGFGLPTYQWQDNIRAYNFFRLISRAKEVHAIYDSRKSDRTSGEPSRYLTLLTHIYNRKATHIEASLPLNPMDSDSLNFALDREKIHAYQEQLRPEGKKRLSPSSLIKFITCPRQFYFENILGLRQEDEVSEMLLRKDLGTFIHNSIQQLYKDFEGKIIDSAMLESIPRNNIAEVVKNNFCDALGLDPNNIEGYINAYIKTAEEIVLKQIEMDKENSPFEYIGGEVSIHSQLEYAPGDFISLGGILDRIDKSDDMVRIIDYKTGGDKFDGDILKSFDENNKHTFKVLLQLLTYCYMVLHPAKGKEIIENMAPEHLLPLMMKPWEQKQDLFINDHKNLTNYQEVQSIFEDKLRETVARLMDSNCPFQTNNKKANCSFCGGANICSDANIDDF